MNYFIKLVYNSLPFNRMGKKKVKRQEKKLLQNLPFYLWPKPHRPYKTHVWKTLYQFWPKRNIFAKKHISNCSFTTRQCIYWDFLTFAPCVWPLIPRNVAAFKKRKMHAVNGYQCMDFWRAFDKLWPSTVPYVFLSHIANNCIIRSKKNWKNPI